MHRLGPAAIPGFRRSLAVLVGVDAYEDGIPQLVPERMSVTAPAASEP